MKPYSIVAPLCLLMASTCAGLRQTPDRRSVEVPAQPAASTANPQASIEPKRMILTDSKPVFNNIIFDRSTAVLREKGRIELDRLIEEMKRNPDVVVVVEGHTCDIGSAQDNLALGQRRADAVKRYLVEQGIDAQRITAVSVGENDPLIPNESELNRKLNRSVTLDANFPFEGALVPAE